MPIALHPTLTRIFSLIFAFALFANPATAQLTRAGAFERSSVDDAIPELVLAVTDPSTTTGRVAAATAVLTAEVLRSRPVVLDVAVLHQLRDALTAGQSQTLRIAFFDDAALLVQIHRTERVGRSGTAYIGAVPGIAISSVVIVEENGVLSGNVNVLNKKYQIRNVGAAGHVMRQINADALPPDHSAVAVKAAVKSSPMRSKERVPAEIGINTAIDDGTLIDVMVVYTPAARISQGGTAAMNSLVNLAVVETNNAYANSLVTQRVRLVYAGEVSYVESNFATDLARLQGADDGFMDAVHQLRNLYGADLVSLWGNYTGGCGLANLMLDETASFASQGFNVVDRNCATNNLSFAHELGHNMGLQHDLFDGNGGTTVTPEGSAIPTAINYAHGYVDLINRFRSVMAISALCDAQVPPIDCVRLPYFSNPNVILTNVPTGNINAQEFRALNDTRETTANFRGSVNLAGPGTVIFEPANYVVSEAVNAISLSVTRHAGAFGAVSISYATLAGTAVVDTDFTAQSGVLVWANGETGTKTISVPILQDNVLDGPKSFTVTLSGATGGASIGAPGGLIAAATVMIVDANTDSFPSGCMPPLTGWTIPAPGWAVATDTFFGPACSLKSNPVADGNSAQIRFSGIFTDGNIRFARRVSSQKGADCLRFFIDGVEKNIGGTCDSAGGLGASGEVAWDMLGFPVTAGTHTLVWIYEKDGAGAMGADAAWIDSVVLPLAGAAVIQSAPPPDGLLNIPYSHTFFTSGGAPITYALLAATLPDGLVLNTVTGVISGVPRRLGTFTGFVRAFNDFPPFVQQLFSINIVGAAPGAPLINSAASGNGQASIDFTPPASQGSAPITSFTSTCNPGTFTGTSTTEPVLVAGLVNGVEYACVVSATNIYGTGTNSTPILVTPAAAQPGAPVVSVATAGDGRAFISFSPPLSDGGSPITSYTAICNPGALTGTAIHSPVIVSNLLNRTLYGCSVTASNAIGTSIASATAAVIPTPTAPLTLIGVVSRKTHGFAGDFDLPIDNVVPINGATTVDPRIISASAGHTVVFKFNTTVSAGVAVSVVDTTNAAVAASVNTAGSEVIVTIPTLADATRVTVRINGVNGSAQVFSASLAFFVGDVNNSFTVNASDINSVKARSGQATNASTFKFDLNTTGSISAADTAIVKARSGLTMP